MECNFSNDGSGVIDIESKIVAPEPTTDAAPALPTAGGQVFADANALIAAQNDQASEIATLEAKLAAAKAKALSSPGVPACIQSGAMVAPAGIVLGDKIPDFKDIVLPRINIVQAVGQLKDQFTQGAIIFGQNTVLFEPLVVNKQTGNVERPASPPVVITVLGFRPTRFVEKIQGGARGLLVDTEEQVRASGGTLDYKEWMLKKAAGMKRFEQLAEALMVIERPAHIEDDDTLFTYEVGGKKYALALWSMKGTAYTAAAKRVFFTNRSVGCLKQGYPTKCFHLTTKLESYSSNTCWVPVCIPGAASSPEFMDFARAILNPPAQ